MEGWNVPALSIDEEDSQMDARTLRLATESGVVGGLILGVLLAITGLLPLAGRLVGDASPATGLAVHVITSAIIGFGFASVFGRWEGCPGRTFCRGLGRYVLYGGLWWVVIYSAIMGASAYYLV